MTSRWREKLKAALEATGLLPTALAVQERLTVNELKTIHSSFKFYLYNHWLTNFPSNTTRVLYLRNVLGLHVGDSTFVHMGCHFEGEKISIGDNTVIGRNCFLGGNGGALIIKNNVSITARTYIFCASHLVDSPDFASVHKDVIIEDHAWIGAGATIMPGVTIGEGAVLGAVAAATKDVPAYSIWAGVPAKEIGTRSRNLTYTLKYRAYFN